MPYRNIVWVKLEIRLLHDPRFFTMSDQAQLIFVKLLLLCASFKNKVPRKYEVLKELLRTSHKEAELDSLIAEIREHFPKVLAHKEYYYIRGFNEHTNWVAPRNSQGTPTEDPGLEQNKNKKKIREEYLRLKGWKYEHLAPSDFGRIDVCIKSMLKRANDDAEMVIEALKWGSGLNWERWSIEYVTKNWAEFMKYKEKGAPAASQEVDISHLGK